MSRKLSACDYDVLALSPVMKQGELSARVVESGQNTLRLGNQCVITAYSSWDKYFRKEIAQALGIPTEDVKSDFWGDMRLIRHALVHKKGIAHDKMADCKGLTWFKPGEKIVLDYAKIREIFIGMCDTKNQIHGLSLPSSPEIIL